MTTKQIDRPNYERVKKAIAELKSNDDVAAEWSANERLGFFEVEAASGTIHLVGDISPLSHGGASATELRAALKTIGNRHCHFRINTLGGAVDEGCQMFNALRKHKAGVTTYCDSVAASMGSYLLQAGERRLIARNGMVMVHNPHTRRQGDAESMRKEAEVLDKYRDRMMADFTQRTGKTEGELKRLFDAETWYTGPEAVTEGFADAIDAPEMTVARVKAISAQIKRELASHDPQVFKHRKRVKQAAYRAQLEEARLECYELLAQ